jgi:choline dehydrogenase-like flavoprotein
MSWIRIQNMRANHASMNLDLVVTYFQKGFRNLNIIIHVTFWVYRFSGEGGVRITVPAAQLDANPEILLHRRAESTQDLSALVAVTQEFLFNDGAIVPCLQEAFSRGSVTINSTSPFAPPVIDSRYLSNPLDIRLLVEGFKYTRRTRATHALQSITAFEIYPGGTVKTDEQIESFIRQTISTESHHAGTAAVLPPGTWRGSGP